MIKITIIISLLLVMLSVTACDTAIQEPQGNGTLGAWYDDLGDPTFTDATLNILKENGAYYLERVNGDGSIGKYQLKRDGDKFIKINDKFGAYYVISNSNLKIYDSNGFIRAAKKITSNESVKKAIVPTEKAKDTFINNRERKIINSLLDYDEDCIKNNNLEAELFVCRDLNEGELRAGKSAIKASDIFNEYKQNEIAADLKYKGKHQHIVGIVYGVNRDISNNRIVNLKIKTFQHVSAYIKSDVSDERLAALKVGSKIYLGSCYGTGMVMGIPIFKDCNLIDNIFLQNYRISYYNKFKTQCIDELDNSLLSKRKVADDCYDSIFYYLFARDLSKQCPADSKNEDCVKETYKTVSMLTTYKKSDDKVINKILNDGYSYIKEKTGIDYRK